MMILTILERQLRHSETLLSELHSPLATTAKRQVHDALMAVQTLQRIEERKHSVHVLGQRDAA